jgi:uncharacterized protein
MRTDLFGEGAGVMGDGPVRASLFGTRQHELFCGGRGRSYVLSVALPEDYRDSRKRYPVVYILDGDILFGMAALTMSAAWAQEAPELIAVGIGYGVDSYDQWAKLRELDLALPGATSHDATTANSPQPDLFLQTLREDIVPFVDHTYRTLPDDRCLYGYSWGGFFVLYALLRAPDVFRRYISGSGFVDPTTEYLCREAGLLGTGNSNLNATCTFRSENAKATRLPGFKNSSTYLAAHNVRTSNSAQRCTPAKGTAPQVSPSRIYVACETSTLVQPDNDNDSARYSQLGLANRTRHGPIRP